MFMRYLWLCAALLCCQFSFAQSKKQITLEDLFRNNTFRSKSVPGFNAMKDGKRYTQIDKDSGKQFINIYDLATGKKLQTIFDNSKNFPEDGSTLEVEDYTFSDDEQKILLRTESQNIYRRSVLNKVFVFDLKANEIKRLDTGKVLHTSFSPDGKKVAFVKNNNLYFNDLKYNQVIPVARDGEWNKIINGNCDWVYEEEFEFTKAYEWCPDSRNIAFYKFNETNVPTYTLPMYEGLYPRNYTYKYPKAGEPNSVVQIIMYNIESTEHFRVKLGTDTDIYIPRIKWTADKTKLCIYRMNRHQNKLELLLANSTDAELKDRDYELNQVQTIYTEENKYYIEISDDINFLPDGHSMIFMTERDGNNHLYKWDWKTQKLTCLTPGNFDVSQLVGVDKERKLVYYIAAENTPVERKLYAVNWDGKKKKLLTPEDGTHSITQVSGFNYFLDKHSNINQPPVFYLRDNKGKIVRTLEDNHEQKNKMGEYDLGKIELTQVKIDGDKSLNAWMMYPPNFDKAKKYPVLMYQYSGPNSQEAGDRFPIRDFFWHQMLAQKGYVIVCADGTGTGMRGEEFKKKTYLQLGKYETDDQIAVAKALAKESWVDKDRIGIWGWSYGGFMSSNCILKGNDVFKMAVAVAPVTDWKYYDNIYTERYMRTPQENKSGYEENAPEKLADRLKGKFLLVHGTADDNVHFQNSIMFVDALIKAGKEFDSEYYPNKAHGISGGNTRYHLYKRMTDFILKNL
jgi:dipeptidyl-peptidase-4